MDTRMAFMFRQATIGRERMVFDWDAAAEFIKKTKPEHASAGLRDDKEYTEGTIYADGQPVFDDYTYLASTWAVPEIDMDGEVYPCFKMQHEVPDWDNHTKWPESALAILGWKGETREES